ncbi:uncharacterized protein AKAME5_002386900 [Lates japonicus]|uniref:Uncharacterized protein n=1 Tax=Lates japonicus TaxID=270547 RepID=A0AAD3NK06_LATJO|nr:uncharacterized protein AKAME5_002386900 [Lates japonicus]
MGLLSGPHTNLCTFGDRAFSVAAPTLWNLLPSKLCNALSLDSFKKFLKIHLFNKAYSLLVYLSCPVSCV